MSGTVAAPGTTYNRVLGLYVVVAFVCVAANAVGYAPAAEGSQVLAVPLLVATLVWRAPTPLSREVRWMLAALVLCWLGDSLPRVIRHGDAATAAMLVPFLFAQVCFCVTYWPQRRAATHLRRWLPPLYVLAYAGLVVLAATRGSYVAAVIVYGAALTAMAVLANGMGGRIAAGAAVFFVSDALIALTLIGVLQHGHRNDAVVMATYLIALALIVNGMCARSRQPGAAEGKRIVGKASPR